MIIVSDKNVVNRVNFHKNYYILRDQVSNYKLVLRNRGTNKEYEFYPLEDLFEYRYAFYTFDIDFSKLPQDEYEYALYTYEPQDPFIIDFDIWPIKYFKDEKINMDGNPTYSPKEEVWEYELPIEYPYTFYAWGKYSEPENIIDPAWFINYYNFVGSETFLGGEYKQEDLNFYGVLLNLPQGTTHIRMNANNYDKDFLIRAHYEEKPEDYGQIVSTGLIRLNDLNSDNIIFNDNKTYIAYDKQ